MADYIISDFKTMEEIWNDLLRLHWDYLDTEENMEKLDMRRKLEDELKNFLSVVQHDRKFFLTETAYVFKQSVLRMDKFSAYKAMMGFEAISQYANNLFRKPWRKEYRCIKMYSGYYQHEIKANIVDGERMFEAMGYTLLPNESLILDGPICPDQVTNVSRDAMTAYVECQIMKQIFQGLIANQIQTTWQEIYEFREKHTGTASHAIKSMVYAFEKRRQRKEKQYESCYSNIPPPQVFGSVCNASSLSASHNQQAFCSSQHHVVPSTIQSKPVACNALYSTNPVCSQNCAVTSNYNDHGVHGAHANHPSIPHSKSLEHYHQPASLENHHGSRHSFDQSISYKNNYDCLDGKPHLNGDTSTNGYHCGRNTGNYHQPICGHQTTEGHYNIPGNRYPLPATHPQSEHHYAQIVNFERGDNNYTSAMGQPCCHQNPHYECLNNFNARN